MTGYFSEIIRRNSPEYVAAYREGYEQAKKEMLDKIKSMQALYETTTIGRIGAVR